MDEFKVANVQIDLVIGIIVIREFLNQHFVNFAFVHVHNFKSEAFCLKMIAHVRYFA